MRLIVYGPSGHRAIKTVTGTVTSSEDDAPIPGVNIVIKNTTTGSVTDVNGQYSLAVGETDILIFSSIGFTTQEIPVAGRSVIDVTMESDVRSLEELVVVGYGSRSEEQTSELQSLMRIS